MKKKCTKLTNASWSTAFHARGQCYKTFYGCKLRIFVIIYSVFTRKYKCMQVRQEPTPGAPLKGRLLSLLTNDKLGCKGLPGANTLAHYKNL